MKMSRKAGYKVLNLKGTDLSSASFTLDGVYESIEGNYYKALLLSGIVINSVEKADVFVTAEVDSNANYVIKAYDKTITIASDDTVTVADGGNHLYLYNVHDDYIFSTLILPFKFDNLRIDYDATELTEEQQSILLKINNYLKNNTLYLEVSSSEMDAIPKQLYIYSSSNSIGFNFEAFSATDLSSNIEANYIFTINDNEVTIDDILDTTIASGLRIDYVSQLF